MAVDPERISRDIEAIAGFNETGADLGYSRPTFSNAWRDARDYVISQAKAAGCKVRIDAAGNVHARHASINWNESVWLSGSHIDSVPTGGKFDGVVGVVCPLEILRAAQEVDRAAPLELIIFAEEEGTTFGLGMIGSRLWTGAMSPDDVRPFRNQQGEDFFGAGRDYGVCAQRLERERLQPRAYRGLIELHIEQGPALWEEGRPLAIVTAIAGRRQFRATLRSMPNHAGSTPMSYRKDALLAAARVIVGVDAIAREVGHGTVATVGRITNEPNAINVISGDVKLTVDVRSPDATCIARCGDRLKLLVDDCRLDEVSLVLTEDQPPIQMDRGICDRLCSANGDRNIVTTSGALHDAAILAPLIPTAMLFIASKDGVSHNPAEFSRIEDIAAAAEVLERLVDSG